MLVGTSVYKPRRNNSKWGKASGKRFAQKFGMYLKIKKNHGILRIKYKLKLYGSSLSSCPRTGIVPPTEGWIECLDKLPPYHAKVVQKGLKSNGEWLQRSYLVTPRFHYGTVFKLNIDGISSYLFFSGLKRQYLNILQLQLSKLVPFYTEKLQATPPSTCILIQNHTHPGQERRDSTKRTSDH